MWLFSRCLVGQDFDGDAMCKSDGYPAERAGGGGEKAVIGPVVP